MKKILILNLYASTPHTGMGGKHYYISKELVKSGWVVDIYSSRNHHLIKKKSLNSYETIDGINYKYFNLLPYSKSNSIFRVVNWFLFSFLSLFYFLFNRTKYDYVWVSSPSPVLIFCGFIVSKISDCKLIFEVRDIWPLTIVEIGKVSSKHPLILFLRLCEKFAYKNSDFIFSSLEGFNHYLQPTHVKKFIWLPNGISDSSFSVQKSNFSCELPKNHFVVGYIGTLGTANAIKYLVIASKLVNRMNFKVVIVGTGDQVLHLKALAKELNAPVEFFDPVNKSDVPKIIESFDVCYLGWCKSKLYDYGISPNKLPEYLALGKPILHSYSGAFDPISKYGCGITVPAEDTVAISEAIIKLIDLDKSSYEKFRDNAVNLSMNFYNYEVITEKLIREID